MRSTVPTHACRSQSNGSGCDDHSERGSNDVSADSDVDVCYVWAATRTTCCGTINQSFFRLLPTHQAI